MHCTFESGMKPETAPSNHEVADVSYKEDSVVAMFNAHASTLCSQPYEQEVGKRVYYLCNIMGSIVVLQEKLAIFLNAAVDFKKSYLFTPVQRAGDRMPVSWSLWCLVGQRGKPRRHLVGISCLANMLS